LWKLENCQTQCVFNCVFIKHNVFLLCNLKYMNLTQCVFEKHIKNTLCFIKTQLKTHCVWVFTKNLVCKWLKPLLYIETCEQIITFHFEKKSFVFMINIYVYYKCLYLFIFWNIYVYGNFNLFMGITYMLPKVLNLGAFLSHEFYHMLKYETC